MITAREGTSAYQTPYRVCRSKEETCCVMGSLALLYKAIRMSNPDLPSFLASTVTFHHPSTMQGMAIQESIFPKAELVSWLSFDPLTLQDSLRQRIAIYTLFGMGSIVGTCAAYIVDVNYAFVRALLGHVVDIRFGLRVLSRCLDRGLRRSLSFVSRLWRLDPYSLSIYHKSLNDGLH